jgi:hypothetical protein
MYGSRQFFIKSDDSNSYFDIIHLLSHPWRMSLLFLISGVATAHALKRLSPAQLRSKRTRQLVPPLLLGLAFLIPPQLYVYFNGTIGLSISMVEVFARYLTLSPFDLPDGSRTVFLTMEHLWYLAYLWTYTALLVVLAAIAGRHLFQTAGGWLCARLEGVGLLIWPVALFLLLRLVLRPVFPPSANIAADLYHHALYLSCFLGGVVLGGREAFWHHLATMRRPALILALACIPALLHEFGKAQPGDQQVWNSLENAFILSLFRWCVIVAILGHAQALRSWRPPALTYLNRAILSYYVLHQPLMLLIAYGLDRMGIFNAAAFLPIVAMTLGACAVIYEAWRRLNAFFARPQLA